MTSNNFFPPEISKLLEDKGCESQFNIWGRKKPVGEIGWSNWELQFGEPRHRKNIQRAYHISDILCNKQNAILLFGEEETCGMCELNELKYYPNFIADDLMKMHKIKGNIHYMQHFPKWESSIHHLLDLYNSGGEWEKYVSNFLKK